MSKSIFDKRHKALVEVLTAKRKAAGVRQVDLASALDRQQSFIARLESGQRRINVVDLIKLGELLGFDASEVVAELMQIDRAD